MELPGRVAQGLFGGCFRSLSPPLRTRRASRASPGPRCRRRSLGTPAGTRRAARARARMSRSGARIRATSEPFGSQSASPGPMTSANASLHAARWCPARYRLAPGVVPSLVTLEWMGSGANPGRCGRRDWLRSSTRAAPFRDRAATDALSCNVLTIHPPRVRAAARARRGRSGGPFDGSGSAADPGARHGSPTQPFPGPCRTFFDAERVFVAEVVPASGRVRSVSVPIASKIRLGYRSHLQYVSIHKYAVRPHGDTLNGFAPALRAPHHRRPHPPHRGGRA